jgi:hypothetical protein
MKSSNIYASIYAAMPDVIYYEIQKACRSGPWDAAWNDVPEGKRNIIWALTSDRKPGHVTNAIWETLREITQGEYDDDT